MSAGPAVLCFGEALGLIFNPRGTRLRDCAEAGLSFAGAESNVAIGLARLGCPAAWLSVVGEDPVSERILRQLRAEGVDISRVLVSDAHPAALMLRERSGWAEPSVHYWRKTSAFSQRAGDCVRDLDFANVKAVFLSGITFALNPAAREAAALLVAAARARGVPVWLDVNHRRKLWKDDEARATLQPLLAGLAGVFASDAEGRMLTGSDDPLSVGRGLRMLGAREAVLKLGARGAHWFGEGGDKFHAAFPIGAEVDPIGAGDGFNAGFLSGVMDGAAPGECLRRGCACGALACLSDGDWEGLPSRAELARFAGNANGAER